MLFTFKARLKSKESRKQISWHPLMQSWPFKLWLQTNQSWDSTHALIRTSRKLSHVTSAWSEHISTPRATSLPCPHTSLKQVLPCPFINLPMALSLPWESKPPEGKIWLCISNTQLKAKINNHFLSYHLLSVYGCLHLQIWVFLLAGKENCYSIFNRWGAQGCKEANCGPQTTHVGTGSWIGAWLCPKSLH